MGWRGHANAMRFSRCRQFVQKSSLAGFLALAIAGALASPVSAKAAPAKSAPAAARQPVMPLLPTGKAQQMADWIMASGDNAGMAFIIVDKPGAKAFVFTKDGQLLGSAWVLVGLAKGDDSIPGIGTMPLSAIRPEMRTTPAGRFVAMLGHDLDPADVLWVDYKDAISLHRVINTEPAERRLQRIVSTKPSEHRISFGCINVPIKFFDTVVEPTFQQEKGVVYILPDVKTLQDVFPAYYDVKGAAAAGQD